MNEFQQPNAENPWAKNPPEDFGSPSVVSRYAAQITECLSRAETQARAAMRRSGEAEVRPSDSDNARIDEYLASCQKWMDDARAALDTLRNGRDPSGAIAKLKEELAKPRPIEIAPDRPTEVCINPLPWNALPTDAPSEFALYDKQSRTLLIRRGDSWAKAIELDREQYALFDLSGIAGLQLNWRTFDWKVDALGLLVGTQASFVAAGG